MSPTIRARYPGPEFSQFMGAEMMAEDLPAVQGRARLLRAAEPSARRGGHAGQRFHGRDRAGGGTQGRGPAVDARHVADEGIRDGRHVEGIARGEAAAGRRPHHRGQRQPDLRRRQRRHRRQRSWLEDDRRLRRSRAFTT